MIRNIPSMFFFLIIGLLFVDIGNPNALRQGTEGFYLLISQEMFEANDLLTPRVYGDFHWSKPPFQFWLPMPFYYLFGDGFLLWGRVSILIFSLSCCFLISIWYENELKRNWHEVFGLLLCPLYFIKYGRIFMMEMALAYLSTLCVLYFFSYIQKSKKSGLVMGSLFGGLSILVKGPVSFLMIAPPIGLFSIYKEKRFPAKAIVFLFLTGLLGSLWFLLSYIRFGDEFFHYFFIRENLGKFHSKNYPITSVIQGLFIYTFPVFILLAPTLKHFNRKVLKAPINVFLLLSFVFFYLLWFLPKQKSHHYAVPAIPILLIFISYNFNNLSKILRHNYQQVITRVSNVIFVLGGLVSLVIFYFRESLVLNESRFYILGSLFCVSLWTFLNKKNFKLLTYLKFILPFIFLWQFLLPLGILPTVPSQLRTNIPPSAKLFVTYRKPFFIQETLQRKIVPLPNEDLSSSSLKPGDYIFIGRPHLLRSLSPSYSVVFKWKVWKRGARFSHIVEAIKAQDISMLQESFALIKKL